FHNYKELMNSIFEYKLWILTVSLLVITLGCNNSDDNEGEANLSIEEGRRMQLESSFDQNIIPFQNNHIQSTTSLRTVGGAFVADPTVATLENLKNEWKTSFLVFKSVELYKIGTVQITFAQGAIHRWPAEISFIEDNIQGTATIDNAYINTLGATSKGYSAIEYLLFQNDSEETITAFTEGEFAERRMQYLAALLENLEESAVNLRDIWQGRETAFKENLGSGVAGSHNQLVNGYIALLETMKIRKLDKALNSNPYRKELLEAFFSEASLSALSENLDILWKEYAGASGSSNEFTMSDYLIEVLGQNELDTEVRNAYQAARTALNAIQDPLEDAVPNQRNAVEALRDRLADLIALYKVDISSAANIVVTFNDNDGDS
ncbi:MAG: imelysin family protein, partial [Bacteroidota bacterium]